MSVQAIRRIRNKLKLVPRNKTKKDIPHSSDQKSFGFFGDLDMVLQDHVDLFAGCAPDLEKVHID